jgi:phosphohistidine phosphatase
MRWLLVQHGKNLPKDVDPDKSLSPEGETEVRSMAEVARDHGVRVDRIVHSGKKRALQTADIMAESLSPAAGVDAADNLGPMDDPAAVIQSPPGTEENLMLVGHMPFMGKMAGLLVAGSADAEVFRFQNGGIVCIEPTDDGGWAIAWSLSPNVS